MKLRFFLFEGTITLGSNSVFVVGGQAEVPEPFATQLKRAGLAWDAPAPVLIVEEKHEAEEEQPIAEEIPEEPEVVEEEPSVQPKRTKGRPKKTNAVKEVI